MEKLPKVLPVFMVRSTILMPHAQLPITMSESDYVLAASETIENNVVAIIQPRPIFIKGARNKELIHSFKTGCAGRITEVVPNNGNVTINVYGLCRFETLQEIPSDSFRTEKILVSYDKFLIDMEKGKDISDFDKNRLMNALDGYFKNLEISPNWREIEKTPVEILVSALAIACPFHPTEKQSILETVDIKERSDMITKIIEMNSFDRYNIADTIN